MKQQTFEVEIEVTEELKLQVKVELGFEYHEEANTFFIPSKKTTLCFCLPSLAKKDLYRLGGEGPRIYTNPKEAYVHLCVTQQDTKKRISHGAFGCRGENFVKELRDRSRRELQIESRHIDYFNPMGLGAFRYTVPVASIPEYVGLAEGIFSQYGGGGLEFVDVG